MKRFVCLLLAVVMVLSMTACGKDKKQETKEYDGAALLQAMLEQVKFDDTMSGVGDTTSNTVAIDYDAIVTPVSTAVTNTQVASVLFVIGWECDSFLA